MAVKQLSVVLPNVPGALAKLSGLIESEGIYPKAVINASIAENSVVRIVVNDPDRAIAILDLYKYEYEINDVLAVEVPIHPGGVNAILKPLAMAGINILYLYTTINRQGRETILVLGVDKLEEAVEVLTRNWVTLVGEELYSL